ASTTTAARLSTFPEPAATPRQITTSAVYMGCLAHRYSPRATSSAWLGTGDGVSADPRSRADQITPTDPMSTTASATHSGTAGTDPQSGHTAVTATAPNSRPCNATMPQRPPLRSTM